MNTNRGPRKSLSLVAVKDEQVYIRKCNICIVVGFILEAARLSVVTLVWFSTITATTYPVMGRSHASFALLVPGTYRRVRKVDRSRQSHLFFLLSFFLHVAFARTA